MAKKIQISGVHAIEFNQRAAGEETPYYVGTIWDISDPKATKAGEFRNQGTGGSTNVRLNPPDRDALAKLGESAFSDLGIESFEADGHVIMYAEFIGYKLKCTCDEFTLQDFTDLIYGDSDFGDTTTEQKVRAGKSDKKASGIKMMRDAIRVAKQGKTVVRIGDSYYTYGTRDTTAIRRSAEQKFKGVEIEILA